MKKSLECLYSGNKASLDGIQASLGATESADVFAENYDMAKQRQLEEGAYSNAIEVWKFEMNEARKRGDVYTSRLGIRRLAWDWIQAMKPVLAEHIERIRPHYVNSEGTEMVTPMDRDTESARLEYVWLTALSVEKLCAITIMEVIRLHMSEVKNNGCKAGNLISEIGRAVEREIQAADLVKKENRGLLPKSLNLRQLFAKKNRAEQYASQFHNRLVNGMSGGTTHWPFEWRQDIRAKVSLVSLQAN
jgi:DNA-directed RNA polymerase, mitochondrial